MTYLKDFWV